eukprot:scaffold197478_cov59-Cyclotella_meneghiniana.AAC.1
MEVSPCTLGVGERSSGFESAWALRAALSCVRRALPLRGNGKPLRRLGDNWKETGLTIQPAANNVATNSMTCLLVGMVQCIAILN